MSSPQALPPLIQQMRQPDFYPHPTAAEIELVQTHTAYVLLTGDYAYKIKKPVNYGFLNYSTLDLRQRYCEAEVRLNQRTARELYLGVVPIYGGDDRYCFAGLGRPVEYAVKMRQFPQGCLFLDLLHQGQLTADLMQQLAHQVANLHAKAAVDDHIRSFGTVAQIRRAIDENYAQSQPYLGRGQTQQQLEETRAYTDRMFSEEQAVFQQRLRDSRIREGHGDLHLRNICLWNQRVYLFDCIEFNEAFRYVDTMYDVAFTVMDCDGQGRTDLGNIFLNTYLELTGDWAGVKILPLYLSRQAYVRAKVTSFLLDDPAIDPAQRSASQRQAERYYRQAWQYTRPRSGRLILMSGLSGSGKSTLARQLAQRLGAVHIRSDAVRKHLAQVPLHQRGTPELYTPALSQATYGRLLSLGLELAQAGNIVILDAKYDRAAQRQQVLTQAAAIPAFVIQCCCPLEVLRQRLEARSGDISDATAELLERQQAAAEPLTPTTAARALELDTSGDIATALAAVSQWLLRVDQGLLGRLLDCV